MKKKQNKLQTQSKQIKQKENYPINIMINNIHSTYKLYNRIKIV